MNAKLVTATSDIDAGTAGSAAALKATADSDVTTKVGLLNTAATNWDAKAKLTSTAFTEYLKTTYTEVVAGPCATATSASNAAATDALCKTACDGLLAWTEVAGMPTVGTVPAGNTYCFGYEFDTTGNTCKLYHTAIPTAGSVTANFKCYKRDKSAGAIALFDADALSKTTATLYTTMNTAFTNWLTAVDTADEKLWKLDSATKYKTELNTLNTAANTAATTAGTAYTTVNGELTALVTDYNTKNTNLTT